MHAQTTLPALVSSPGVARRWALDLLRAELAQGPDGGPQPWVVSDAAVELVLERTRVIVSELVSNAVVHARSETTVALTVTWPGGSHVEVRVDVSDGDSRLPRLDPVDDQALGGRGLQLVVALSDGVGHDVTDLGKTVWSQFDVDLALGARPAQDGTAVRRTGTSSAPAAAGNGATGSEPDPAVPEEVLAAVPEQAAPGDPERPLSSS